MAHKCIGKCAAESTVVLLTDAYSDRIKLPGCKEIIQFHFLCGSKLQELLHLKVTEKKYGSK
jgi:hypothetical protein